MSVDNSIRGPEIVDREAIRHINRSHDTIPFEQMVEGLITFRQEFKGQYWLEVFLLAGYTSVIAEVEKIATWVGRIRPDRVQLNTITRPPAEAYAEQVPGEQLARLAGLFTPHAEIIEEYAQPRRNERITSGTDRILDMLCRRPCMIEDFMAAHGLHRNEAIKCLDELRRRGMVERVIVDSEFYYRATRAAATIATGGTFKEST